MDSPRRAIHSPRRRGGRRKGTTATSRLENNHVDDQRTLKAHTGKAYETFSSSDHNHQTSDQILRDSMFVPLNSSVKKFDEKEIDDSRGSAQKSEIDSTSHVKNGIEVSADEPTCSELRVGGIRDDINECKDGGEMGILKIEVLNSGNEVNEDVTVKRLMELRLSVEEPAVSEEHLSVNKQLQEDELLALESIYGDNISILDSHSALKCVQVHIHTDVVSGIDIIAKFNSDSQDGRDDELPYSFHVNYLPPIILTCLLPQSYPSLSAPYFTISVQWLALDKISDLCYKLDSIWQEQVGQEVLYEWVKWLNDSSLSYLGLNDKIVLSPYDLGREEDRRVIACSTSPEIDIPLLKTYNDERRNEDFCTNIQECCICFCELPGSEFIRLPCQHFFCGKCMKTFSDLHIKEGTVLKLKCPETKCEGMIPPGLLKRLLGNEEYQRWEALTLQRTLEAMSDVVYCPRCETACLEDEEDHAQCSKCYFSFCTLCYDRRHVGVACITPEMKLVILQERQKSTSMKGAQRRQEQDMINQLLSVKAINSHAKLCPSCNMAISRTEGCNKMVCSNCGEYFCYRCGIAITGYEHFRGGSCELFPVEEIQKWEERNAQQVAGQLQAQLFGQVRAQLFPDQMHRCPNCGQQNAKVGQNNHVFCWACQNHFCYLCGKMVRRCSEHYGPKGCKQHTVG